MEIDTLDIVYVYNVSVYKPGLHTNFFSWWPDRATKIITYQFLVARTGNLVARKKKSEMNDGNIRLRMTLKINVGCLSLASEMNGGNIRVRMTLRINVGCLSLTSEVNGGNIRLLMTLNKCRVFAFTVGNE